MILKEEMEPTGEECKKDHGQITINQRKMLKVTKRRRKKRKRKKKVKKKQRKKKMEEMMINQLTRKIWSNLKRKKMQKQDLLLCNSHPKKWKKNMPKTPLIKLKLALLTSN